MRSSSIALGIGVGLAVEITLRYWKLILAGTIAYFIIMGIQHPHGEVAVSHLVDFADQDGTSGNTLTINAENETDNVVITGLSAQCDNGVHSVWKVNIEPKTSSTITSFMPYPPITHWETPNCVVNYSAKAA